MATKKIRITARIYDKIAAALAAGDDPKVIAQRFQIAEWTVLKMKEARGPLTRKLRRA